MNTVKADLIMQTATDIVKYIDETYNTDVDLYDIVELININMGFVFDTCSDLVDRIDDQLNEED